MCAHICTTEALSLHVRSMCDVRRSATQSRYAELPPAAMQSRYAAQMRIESRYVCGTDAQRESRYAARMRIESRYAAGTAQSRRYAPK